MAAHGIPNDVIVQAQRVFHQKSFPRMHYRATVDEESHHAYYLPMREKGPPPSPFSPAKLLTCGQVSSPKAKRFKGNQLRRRLYVKPKEASAWRTGSGFH